jgi:spore coat protein CotH
MTYASKAFLTLTFSLSFLLFAAARAQEPPPFGPPGGPGGFGGVRQKIELVAKFDKDGNKVLDLAERKAAREHLAAERAAGRGRRGPGGRGGFGPGGIVATQMLSQADANGDRALSGAELARLAETWFDTLDPGREGKLDLERFRERLGEILPPPGGPGGPGGGEPRPAGGRGPGGFGPAGFLAPGLFTAVDADKDGTLAREEWKASFGRWSSEWDFEKGGGLTEEELRRGLDAAIPPPRFEGGPGFRGPGRNRPPPEPGAKVSPADVKAHPDAPLYDTETLRTFFLEFETPDWEKELADFHGTDVEVPATLTVDGKTYRDVGVHFRGMSSFMMVGEGWKRSFNLSLDFVHEGQNVGGYRTLNLLNANGDPTFLRLVLFSGIARQYIPTPKANLARVVVNGESWGVYVNAQQFNRDFVKEWFGTTRGARWKVPGSPGGRGSLTYLGDDAEKYRGTYELKSREDPKSWEDLIKLTKVLGETPAADLEQALSPLLDIDGALKFLALDNALINSDGYWIRTSDYCMYQDEGGRFHLVPGDVNETFSLPGGPGFGGGPGGRRGRGPGGPEGAEGGRGPEGRGPEGRGPGEGGRGGPPGGGGPGFGGGPRVNGVELDPLQGADDPRKPLISKLLAVPALRARYIGYVREIAEKHLDWEKLGATAARHRALIEADVEADTRKLDSIEDFRNGIADAGREAGSQEAVGRESPGPRRGISLERFARERRAFLLKYDQTAGRRARV